MLLADAEATDELRVTEPLMAEEPSTTDEMAEEEVGTAEETAPLVVETALEVDLEISSMSSRLSRGSTHSSLTTTQ